MVEEGHPFYFHSADEVIQSLKVARVNRARAFWAKFHGASNGVLAVVGDFDPEETKQLLSEVFDGWSSTMEYEHMPYQYVRQDSVFVDIETPDKTNASLYAVLNLPVYEEHEDFPHFR